MEKILVGAVDAISHILGDITIFRIGILVKYHWHSLLIRQRERDLLQFQAKTCSKLVDDKDSPNTMRATKLAVRIFKDCLTEKNIPHRPFLTQKKFFYVDQSRKSRLKFLYKEFLITSLRFGLISLTTHTLRKWTKYFWRN